MARRRWEEAESCARAVSWLIVTALVFLTIVLCSGCVSVAAIEQARTEQAVNRGHADDETLPVEARLIAEDNYDAWSAQLYNLAGDRLPADVVQRLRIRGALPEGYEAGE